MPKTVGSGVEIGVLRLLRLRITMMHAYWEQRGSYMGPIFLPLTNPDRLAWWKTFGFVLGLHVFVLKLWPTDFSPLLFLALEGGKDALCITPESLQIIDTDTASRMGAWLAHTPGEPIPTEIDSPMYYLLLEVVGMQVCMPIAEEIPGLNYSTQPSQVARAIHDIESHHSWTQLLISRITFGPEDPWTNQEFLTLQEGFDISLNGLEGIDRRGLLQARLISILLITFCPLSRHVKTFGDTFKEVYNKSYAPSLIAAMSNRRIVSPTQVVEKLEFQMLEGDHNQVNNHFIELFQRHMRRYLNGTGHPDHPNVAGGQLMTPQNYNEGIGNTCLRAELFLQAATDSNLLPAESHWQIKVNDSFNIFIYTKAIPTTVRVQNSV
jgi:hypothetical protein